MVYLRLYEDGLFKVVRVFDETRSGPILLYQIDVEIHFFSLTSASHQHHITLHHITHQVFDKIRKIVCSVV